MEVGNITRTDAAFHFQAFVKEVVSTMEEGQALWYLLQNQHIYRGNTRIPTGTFRWNAHIIASVCGGSYLNYYCAVEIDYYEKGCGHFRKETREKIERKLAELHIILKDAD